MDAGLGRGIPAGLGRLPPPTPKGLLPARGGRAPPGRGAAGVPGPPGRPAPGVAAGRGGAGPGRGGAAGVPAAGGSGSGRCRACWAALTVASCSALRAAARASAAATSMSWALAGLTTGGVVGTGAFFAGALFGGAGRADTRGSPAGAAGADATGAGAGAGAVPASSAARSRRATGASTVLDADLTNSPISLSLASTVLLSTPSSFASSCTRALPATALLTPRPRGQVPAATSLLHLKPDHCGDFIVCSCRSSYLAVVRGSRPRRVSRALRATRPAVRCRRHRRHAARARRRACAPPVRGKPGRDADALPCPAGCAPGQVRGRSSRPLAQPRRLAATRRLGHASGNPRRCVPETRRVPLRKSTPPPRREPSRGALLRRPPVCRPRMPRPNGCRSAIRSTWPPTGHSVLHDRWPAKADSPVP